MIFGSTILVFLRALLSHFLAKNNVVNVTKKLSREMYTSEKHFICHCNKSCTFLYFNKLTVVETNVTCHYNEYYML